MVYGVQDPWSMTWAQWCDIRTHGNFMLKAREGTLNHRDIAEDTAAQMRKSQCLRDA